MFRHCRSSDNDVTIAAKISHCAPTIRRGRLDVARVPPEMVGANTTSRCRVEVASRHIALMDAGWLHKMRRTPVMRISILAVLTASLTAVGAQAADAPDEIRLGTVYTGSIACGLSVGGGGGSHAPQPEGARGSARAPSSLSIRAIGSIPSQLQQ